MIEAKALHFVPCLINYQVDNTILYSHHQSLTFHLKGIVSLTKLPGAQRANKGMGV